MGLKKFIKEAEKGFPSGFYFLYSKDPFFLSEATSRITDKIPPEKRSFSLMAFDMENSSGSASAIKDVIGVLNTAGFFGGRKTVILKNTQALKKADIKVLSGYLKDPAPDSLLVMLASKSPPALLKEVLDSHNLFALDMKERELRLWAGGVARGVGVSIDPDALNYIMAITGGDAGRIYSEIEKLSLLGKGGVGLDDIHQTLPGTVRSNVFNLAGSIIQKDARKTFRIYNSLKEGLDPYSIIGAINWKFADLYKKSGKERGGYYRKAFKYMLEADRRLKSSGGEYPLEELLIKLLQI